VGGKSERLRWVCRVATRLIKNRAAQSRIMHSRVQFLGIGLTFCCLLAACRSDAHPVRKYDPSLTPLMNAAAQNDLPRVRELLAHGANVAERTRDGRTVLYEAIERTDLNADNLPIVDALLKAGADPNEVEIFGLNALSVSLTRDYANPSVTLRLLQAGAHVPRDCPAGNSEDSLLSLATMDSSVEVMRELIARGSPVDCQFRGASALYWAALNGQYDRVALLLRSGADPRQQVGEGHAILDVTNSTNPDSRVQGDFAKTRQLLEDAIKSSEVKAR
jgi:ankyrin repeat protein